MATAVLYDGDRLPIRKLILLTPTLNLLPSLFQQQSVAPAWMHLLGILTGHMYYFLTKLLPLLGGTNIISTPQWLTRLFLSKQSTVRKPTRNAKKIASRLQ